MARILIASCDIIIAIFMMLMTLGKQKNSLGTYIGIGIMAYMYIASAILILTH